MNTDNSLKQYSLADISGLKVHGRTSGERDPLTLFWTGSGIECNAKGSELWVEVEADYDQYEPWIGIAVNAVPVSRQMVTRGRHWICVFRGMDGSKAKNIRIVKETQAMSGDAQCVLQIHAMRFDGEFLSVQDKPLKLEFIGDSITSGEGAVGAQEETDWIPMWFSAVDNYTAMTAEALDAEYRVISQSGWGVLSGWDNNPHANIPQYYEKVCGLLNGERNIALGAHDDHDFASWQPDAVVINLGTNDSGAFRSPAWTDAATGTTFKQRLNEDGTRNEEDMAAFEAAVRSFLAKLRQCNKQAHLLWAHGMLGADMLPAITRAVAAYSQATGDANVSVLQLPDTTADTIGARSHPGKRDHERTAAALAERIRRVLSEAER